MTPEQLQPQSFDAYTPAARAFAVKYLPLLRQLPLTVCPSFLAQIALLDTRFPAEAQDLEFQCAHLTAMDAAQRSSLLAPLRAIHLPADLEVLDWVAKPQAFVERLSAALWADGQIDRFHAASRVLLAAVQPQSDAADRLLLVALGAGANTSAPRLMRKLAKRGLRLEQLDATSAQAQILSTLRQRATSHPEPYAHWYVDGGDPWQHDTLPAGVTHTFYGALQPLREHVLQRMRATVRDEQSNAEDMRTRLAAAAPSNLGGEVVSKDPVLQFFYTQLFTQGSGTQIFSTSFVQWAGRELARRAKPHTLLLRYGARQRYRGLNDMFDQPAEHQVDVQGSLADAEMDAFYNWIEMERISSPGRLTTLVWAEGSSRAVLISSLTKPNTVSKQPITVARALAAMRQA